MRQVPQWQMNEVAYLILFLPPYFVKFAKLAIIVILFLSPQTMSA
jgi:hypothetical protein